MIRNLEKKQTVEDEEIKQYTSTGENILTLHVVKAGPNVAMLPLRKLTVIKSLVLNDSGCRGTETKDGIVSIKQENASGELKTEVYEKRKRMLPEYKELFAALMKLPDKEVQKKLLDVINNHKVEQRTVETQTDPVEIKELHNETTDKVVNNGPETTIQSDGQENNISNSVTEVTVKKRKRKRKVSKPQANKESRVKQLARINEPNMTTASIAKPSHAEELKQTSPKRQRIDSFNISECSSDILNICEDTPLTNLERTIVNSMLKLDNGLLPIQDAIIRNQTNRLNAYIHIMQTCQKIDLNDILTEEDEDLLQLAVINTCDPSIVSLLLEKGLHHHNLDADSNTLIHLAILNDIPVKSLEHLMKHIDLKTLLILNDDGYTPLHLAVRQDCYLLAECIINVLDERLSKQVFYKRQLDVLETDESVLKMQFKKYYEKVCLKMVDDEDESNTCIINNHDLKQELLQAADRRSGNIALYFAIDNRHEHLVYFLLAHLTDPRTENLCGVDCKTFFSEFGKSLNLSLNIDNTMEKVINLLS